MKSTKKQQIVKKYFILLVSCEYLVFTVSAISNTIFTDTKNYILPISFHNTQHYLENQWFIKYKKHVITMPNQTSS